MQFVLYNGRKMVVVTVVLDVKWRREGNGGGGGDYGRPM